MVSVTPRISLLPFNFAMDLFLLLQVVSVRQTRVRLAQLSFGSLMVVEPKIPSTGVSLAQAFHHRAFRREISGGRVIILLAASQVIQVTLYRA
jgi:hypothetical protein